MLLQLELYLSINISVFPASIDKGPDVSDIFVELRTFDFFTSLEYKLIDGILRNLF